MYFEQFEPEDAIRRLREGIVTLFGNQRTDGVPARAPTDEGTDQELTAAEAVMVRERELYRDLLVYLGKHIGDVVPEEAPGRLGARNALHRLALGLEDLNAGRRPDLFVPVSRSREQKPDDPSYVWMRRAQVSAALEALHECGLSVKEAAEQIAHRHPWVERLIRKSRPSVDVAKTIVDWRSRLRAQRRAPGDAVDAYWDSLNELRSALVLVPEGERPLRLHRYLSSIGRQAPIARSISD